MMGKMLPKNTERTHDLSLLPRHGICIAAWDFYIRSKQVSAYHIHAHSKNFVKATSFLGTGIDRNCPYFLL